MNMFPSVHTSYFGKHHIRKNLPFLSPEKLIKGYLYSGFFNFTVCIAYWTTWNSEVPCGFLADPQIAPSLSSLAPPLLPFIPNSPHLLSSPLFHSLNYTYEKNHDACPSQSGLFCLMRWSSVPSPCFTAERYISIKSLVHIFSHCKLPWVAPSLCGPLLWMDSI